MLDRLQLAFLSTIMVSNLFATLGAAQQTTLPNETLHELFEREWDYELMQSPTFASYLGDRRYADLWNDFSLNAIEQRHEHDVKLLAELNTFDEETFSPADKVNFKLFKRRTQMNIDGYQYGWYLCPLTNREGIQTENDLAAAMSFETVQDYEAWIRRLESFDVYMDQTLDLMREGIKRKIVHARVVMQPVVGQIRRQIVDNPEASLFYKPFLEIDRSITAAYQTRLKEMAATAIAQKVIPSYKKMLDFFEQEYLPACYEQQGVWQIPNGKVFYAHQAKLYTTTNLTPEEIHQIGLSEVKRIRQEMEAIVAETKFEGTFAEFLTYLRTNPDFYYENANDYYLAVQSVCKKIDPQLVKLFGKLPRIPYGVEPIPANIAPDTTAAYYREPTADGSRAGTYFINLYDPKSRPKYEIEALSLHEAVPGHHLQIALAMELDDLPEFRRYGGYTAFIEGWGLYSESLGKDLGLYQDPYSRFGQLTYEMWRACRLVVDTGIHHDGWTRQQAIDFMAQNTAKTLLDITNEVDRYIAWPGQALAYKIGELKIQELRKRAELQLGENFNIKDFHDRVLSSGAVTLEVLEDNINTWLAEEANPQRDEA